MINAGIEIDNKIMNLILSHLLPYHSCCRYSFHAALVRARSNIYNGNRNDRRVHRFILCQN